MKTFFKAHFLLCFLTLSFFSCQEEDEAFIQTDQTRSLPTTNHHGDDICDFFGAPDEPVLSNASGSIVNPTYRVQVSRYDSYTVVANDPVSWTIAGGITVLDQSSTSITVRANFAGNAAIYGSRSNPCGTSQRVFGLRVVDNGDPR